MKRLRLEIYNPKRKIKVSKEEAIPFLVRLGNHFLHAGGIISFVLSSVIMGIKSFFSVKEKVDNKVFHRKYVELRIKKH